MRLTVVVPTYNRGAGLERALARLIAAVDAAPYPAEIIVVDNNSTDTTAAIVRCFRHRVRYVLEAQQGLSHARNAGIRHAAGDIIAFTDDDVEVAADWAKSLIEAFDAHPEADCIGGRVLPVWRTPPPSWLTRAHWSPLALQDHGDAARVFDERTPLGLVGANVAFRRQVFDRSGVFSPDVQRVRDGIGSTEDHEFLRRLYAAGGRAVYVPHVVVTTEVPAHRLTRAYHRRWHRGHGRFHALMQPGGARTPDAAREAAPAHLLRRAAHEAMLWLRFAVARDASASFSRETRLWFLTGFIQERCAWHRR